MGCKLSSCKRTAHVSTATNTDVSDVEPTPAKPAADDKAGNTEHKPAYVEPDYECL